MPRFTLSFLIGCLFIGGCNLPSTTSQFPNLIPNQSSGLMNGLERTKFPRVAKKRKSSLPWETRTKEPEILAWQKCTTILLPMLTPHGPILPTKQPALSIFGGSHYLVPCTLAVRKRDGFVSPHLREESRRENEKKTEHSGCDARRCRTVTLTKFYH